MAGTTSIAFGLMIHASTIQGGGIAYKLREANTGIPESEVILWVRSWLEHAEQKLKSNIQNQFKS